LSNSRRNKALEEVVGAGATAMEEDREIKRDSSL
jgi:hypothetical protein